MGMNNRAKRYVGIVKNQYLHTEIKRGFSEVAFAGYGASKKTARNI